jgi:DNA-binding NarL/FixJ family response regulator
MSTVTIEITKEISPETIEIVKSLSLGLRARDIGPKLKLSPRTAESRIDQIRKDYEAETQAHLVAIFFRNKLID